MKNIYKEILENINKEIRWNIEEDSHSVALTKPGIDSNHIYDIYITNENIYIIFWQNIKKGIDHTSTHIPLADPRCIEKVIEIAKTLR